MTPRWSGATFLHYAGALVALLGGLALIGVETIEAHAHRPGVAAGWSALALAVALGIAVALRRRHDVLAGLAAFLALVFLGLLVGALVTWVGLEPHGAEFLQRDFEPGLYLVELAVVAGGIALLRGFRFPLLALPVVLTLLYVVADVGAIVGAVTLFVAVAGLLLMAIATAIEPRPAAFWLHLVGGAAFGAALLRIAGDHDSAWFLVLAGSLAYVLVARFRRRSGYAVLAAVGVLAAASHWIGTSVQQGSGALPFAPGYGGEPWHVALAYVVTGVAIALLGLLASGREEADDVGGVVVERPAAGGGEPAERLQPDDA